MMRLPLINYLSNQEICTATNYRWLRYKWWINKHSQICTKNVPHWYAHKISLTELFVIIKYISWQHKCSKNEHVFLLTVDAGSCSIYAVLESERPARHALEIFGWRAGRGWELFSLFLQHWNNSFEGLTRELHINKCVKLWDGFWSVCWGRVCTTLGDDVLARVSVHQVPVGCSPMPDLDSAGQKTPQNDFWLTLFDCIRKTPGYDVYRQIWTLYSWSAASKTPEYPIRASSDPYLSNLKIFQKASQIMHFSRALWPAAMQFSVSGKNLSRHIPR